MTGYESPRRLRAQCNNVTQSHFAIGFVSPEKTIKKSNILSMTGDTTLGENTGKEVNWL